MLTKYFSPYCWVILLFWTSSAFPQLSNYKNLTFEHLSIEHGLSQITVHSIMQDSKGFLWFGTEDGLNRYDGYNFDVFHHDPADTNSISDNFIWSILEDTDQNLWIGTNNGGLSKYNYSTNSFSNYLNDLFGNAINVRIIFEDSKKNLWIGTNNSGLYKFNRNQSLFSAVNLKGNGFYSIRAICEDNNGLLWVGTDENGLYTFDNESNVSSNYNTLNSNLSSSSIWALICDKLNNIWIGTYNGGLNKFDRNKNKFIRYPGKNRSIINENVTNILLDDFNNPWICTEGGLSILDTQTGEYINYEHNVSDLRSLSNSLLRYITIDNSNLIWIGTVGGGINKLNLNKKFSQFNHNPTDEHSLSHNMIRAIEEDSRGNIWIGTLGNGISKYERNENKFYRYNSRTIGLSENIVTAILEDENKDLWVGTWGGGLNKIKLNNNNITSIEVYEHNLIDQNSISSNIVQDIHQDTNGDLWIGTEDGLDKYNFNSKNFEHFRNEPNNVQSISDNRIQSNCIIEDRFGYLWIGTWHGLNRLNIKNKIQANESRNFLKLFKDNGLSDNRIISLYEDSSIMEPGKLIIWIGTIGGGLNKVVFSTKNGLIQNYSILKYSEKDGLPSNVIYGILGDSEGNLWLSTNNGISKFDKMSETFRNYDKEDGLQSNQFFWGAFHKTKDGELYFGGINGLNSFYPDKLVENKNIPPLYITKCSFESSDGSYLFLIDSIEKIKNTGKVDLPYDSYNIRFEFTALDFTTPSKNKYKVILENYDEKWNEISYQNIATYSNVTEGDYNFKVLGSNNDGIWNEEGTSIEIKIETPFWKTWWFILMIIGAITSLVTYFVTSQIKNILALERLRTKLAADLHDNIGSSLTEISILTEVITTKLKTKDDDVRKNLDKISSKSRKLIDKMSDIVWLVNPQRDSLYDLILRLQDSYSDLLSDTEISFRCENLKSLEKVSLSMEHRQHLFLIFKEGINNSITHSKCTELMLNANVNNRVLTMSLMDNGSGFSLNQDGLGNGVKNMQARSKKIGGKFSIESEIGKGTVIKYFGYIR